MIRSPGFSSNIVAIAPAKVCFRTQMAFAHVPYRTVTCDYHAFGALAARPSLILYATFSGHCGALYLVGVVPSFLKSLN